MRPSFIARAVLVGVLALPGAAPAADVNVHITVPPAPHIVFHAEPEVVIVPQTQVEYVPVVTDYDMYRYDKYWYVNQNGYWYRSRSFRGPFTFVEHSHLPHAVVVVPAGYRNHPTRPNHPKRVKHKHKHYDDHDDG